MSTFSCKIVTPEGVAFEKELWQLTVKTKANGFAIRSQHADLIFASDTCTTELAFDVTTREMWSISNSLLEFSNNKCVIVCKGAAKS